MAVKYTTTFVCDRCGTAGRYEMKQVSFKFFLKTWKYDLCRNCMEDFEKWLKNEVAECELE